MLGKIVINWCKEYAFIFALISCIIGLVMFYHHLTADPQIVVNNYDIVGLEGPREFVQTCDHPLVMLNGSFVPIEETEPGIKYSLYCDLDSLKSMEVD